MSAFRWIPHVVHFTSAEGWIAIFTGVTAVVLGVTAAFVLFGLGDARKARHGQLVVDLSRQWDDPQTLQSRRLLSRYGPHEIIALYERLYAEAQANTVEDLDLFYDLGIWPNLIETIGVLHHEGVLSTTIVYKMWGPQINLAWEVWAEPTTKLRDLARSPTSYIYFETLATAMREAKTPAATASAAAHRESQAAAAAAAERNE